MISTPFLPELLCEPVSSEVALLLESRIPARLAWLSGSGTPRIVPIWFVWTGEALAMCTFAGARKLADITAGTTVAVSIDTETFPYRSLKMRGPVTVRTVTGLAEEYEAAAVRYLGRETGRRWIASLEGSDQVVILMRPTWARVADMATDSPFLGS